MRLIKAVIAIIGTIAAVIIFFSGMWSLITFLMGIDSGDVVWPWILHHPWLIVLAMIGCLLMSDSGTRRDAAIVAEDFSDWLFEPIIRRFYRRTWREWEKRR